SPGRAAPPPAAPAAEARSTPPVSAARLHALVGEVPSTSPVVRMPVLRSRHDCEADRQVNQSSRYDKDGVKVSARPSRRKSLFLAKNVRIAGRSVGPAWNRKNLARRRPKHGARVGHIYSGPPRALGRVAASRAGDLIVGPAYVRAYDTMLAAHRTFTKEISACAFAIS